MAKPIKLTSDLIEQAVQEFRTKLGSMKMAGGKLTYSKAFTYDSEKESAIIYFTPSAYVKMVALLMEFSSEVAWHGVCERLSENEFLINDILVYPQTVSGVTVEMDETEYTKWLIENGEDERFFNIHMQGHSHVNMGTSPSPTDLNHQEDILNGLPSGYYIFMIWNKRLEHTTTIFDLDNNILYDSNEIEYRIYGEQESIEDFIADAKQIVKSKSYYPMTTTKTTQTAKQQSVNEKTTAKSIGSSFDKSILNLRDQKADKYMMDYDDDDDRYYGNSCYRNYFGGLY